MRKAFGIVAVALGVLCLAGGAPRGAGAPQKGKAYVEIYPESTGPELYLDENNEARVGVRVTGVLVLPAPTYEKSTYTVDVYYLKGLVNGVPTANTGGSMYTNQAWTVSTTAGFSCLLKATWGGGAWTLPDDLYELKVGAYMKVDGVPSFELYDTYYFTYP